MERAKIFKLTLVFSKRNGNPTLHKDRLNRVIVGMLFVKLTVKLSRPKVLKHSNWDVIPLHLFFIEATMEKVKKTRGRPRKSSKPLGSHQELVTQEHT